MATDKIKYDTVTLQCTRENPPYCVATKVTESGIRGSYLATRTELDTMGATSKKIFTDFYDITKKPTHALTPRSTIPPPKTGAPSTLSLIQPGPIELAINEEKLTSDFITVGAGIDAEYKLDPKGIASGNKLRPPQIKGVNPGKTTLTVTNRNNTSQKVSIEVIVKEASTPPPPPPPEPSLTLESGDHMINFDVTEDMVSTTINTNTGKYKLVIQPVDTPIEWVSSNDSAATVNDRGEVRFIDKTLIVPEPAVTITARVGPGDNQKVVFILVHEPEPEPKTEPGYTFNYKNAESELINGMVLTPIYLNEKVTVDPSNTKIIWRMETEVDNTVAILTNDAFVAKQEGVYTINGALSIDPKKTLPITITVLRPTIKIADGRDTTITKTPETPITLNDTYVTVTNIPINKVKWTANGKKMTDNILSLDDPEKYDLVGTVGNGTDAEQRVVFNVTVTTSSGGRRRPKGSKGSKGTMKGKLVKLRRRMGTRVKRG